MALRRSIVDATAYRVSLSNILQPSPPCPSTPFRRWKHVPPQCERMKHGGNWMTDHGIADKRFELNLASGEHVAYRGWEWREWRRDLSTQETEGMLYRRRAFKNGHLARFRVPEVRIGRFTVVCWPFVPLGGRRSAFFGGIVILKTSSCPLYSPRRASQAAQGGNKPFLNSSRTYGYAISDPGQGSGIGGP